MNAMKTMARKAAALLLSAALAAGGLPAIAQAAQPAGPQVDAAAQADAARAERIDAQAGSFKAGEILVAFQGAGSFSRVESTISLESTLPGARIEQLSADAGLGDGGSSALVSLPDGLSVGQAVVAAERDAHVAHAQPNHKYHVDTSMAAASSSALAAPGATPEAASSMPVDDPYAQKSTQSTTDENQWWLYSVGAPDAWAKMPAVPAEPGEETVTVAVLDTGVNFEHEDLVDNLVAEYAYDVPARKPLTESPTNGEMAHGTHVAGIIAGTANNAKGIAGVGCNYVKVLPICVFELEYSPLYMDWVAGCTDDDLVRAYDYLMSDPGNTGKTIAERTNTRVVNMSLGGYLADGGSEAEVNYIFEAKIAQAQDKAGLLTVAAAGNGDEYGNARSDESYPSDFDEVMSVVALANDTTRTTWSDYNSHKNIAAPGYYILSTYINGTDNYQFLSGTSMACPLVAGCAGLLFAYDPGLSVEDAKQALYSTADDLGPAGFDPYYGWGRVNAAAALDDVASAHIGVERTTMVATTTQTLTASYKGESGHTWNWAVSPANAASIDKVAADGSRVVLTAREPGEFTVSISDARDSSIAGSRTFTANAIALAKAPVVRADGVAHQIDVQWGVADAATGYDVFRSTNGQNGDFVRISGNNHLSASALSFTDADTQPGVEYWYAVQPVGTLGATRPAGERSTAVRGYYTDKGALSSAIARAKALRSETALSEDGSDVGSDSWWAPRADRKKLDSALAAASNALGNGTLLQDDIDEAAAALAQACDDFEAARARGTLSAGEQPTQPAQPDQPTKPSAPVKHKQALSAKAVSKTVKFSKVKKASQKLAGAIAVKGAKTAVSFKVAKVSKAKLAKFFTIDSKGVITVKKGCPKGSCSLTVKATARATSKYREASVSKVVKVTVR